MFVCVRISENIYECMSVCLYVCGNMSESMYVYTCVYTNIYGSVCLCAVKIHSTIKPETLKHNLSVLTTNLYVR